MPPSAADDGNVQVPWINREFLEDIFHRNDGNSDVSVIEKTIELAVAKGDNYLSILYRVRVLLKQTGSDEVQTRHLIIKVLPEGECIQKFILEIGLFKRELQVYNVALPALYRLQKSSGLASLTAQIFCTSRPDTLVLEDLRPQGYVMSERRNRLDLPHCLLVVRALARLHGLSAVLIHREPVLLANFFDTFYVEDNRENLTNILNGQMEGLAGVMETWPGYERFSVIFRNLIPSMVDRMLKVTNPVEFGFKVLLHGDCWNNNILFKYSPTGELVDVRFVDFQVSRVASPALDLHYFLYTNLQDEVREKFTEQILQEYHETLCATVREADPDVKVPTYQQFQDEMRRTMFFGFVATLMLLAPILGEPDDSPDIADIKMEDIGQLNVFEKIYNSPRYRQALQKLLVVFEKAGLFE